MSEDKFKSLADILKSKQAPIKPPAYPWQELALQIVKDLSIPGFKRSAIFKACKDHPAHIIRTALNDTKELCPSGQSWKYFFKIIDNINKEKENG